MNLGFLYVCMVNTIYLFSFVETPRKFIIAIIIMNLLKTSSIIPVYKHIFPVAKTLLGTWLKSTVLKLTLVKKF